MSRKIALSQKIYLYEAESAQIGEQQLDEGEFLSVEQIPLDRAYRMVDSGEIKDAKTIVALMYYRNKT